MSNNAPHHPLRLVVLISGGGTNLQAIIDAAADDLPAEVAAVISNVPEVFGLERARRANIPTEIVDHRLYHSREQFDAALIECIDSYRPDLLILAGFMRILTPAFVQHYQGRMLNIHPSLLPRLQGLHTHQRALQEGHEQHGASVHFVTEELDGGPVVLQASVPVKADDTPQTLAARVLEKEHIIYPLVIRWFAEGRLKYDRDQVFFDGEALESPLLLHQIPAIS